MYSKLLHSNGMHMFERDSGQKPETDKVLRVSTTPRWNANLVAAQIFEASASPGC